MERGELLHHTGSHLASEVVLVKFTKTKTSRVYSPK